MSNVIHERLATEADVTQDKMAAAVEEQLRPAVAGRHRRAGLSATVHHHLVQASYSSMIFLCGALVGAVWAR